MTEKKPSLSEQILECSAEHMTLADWGRAINEWAERAAELERLLAQTTEGYKCCHEMRERMRKENDMLRKKLRDERGPKE